MVIKRSSLKWRGVFFNVEAWFCEIISYLMLKEV